MEPCTERAGGVDRPVGRAVSKQEKGVRGGSVQERDFMDEYVADVLWRFLEGQTDAEDEELARRAPRLYRTVTKLTVRQAEALLAPDSRWDGRYRIPHLDERLVGPRAGHVTEKELEEDLRKGRYLELSSSARRRLSTGPGKRHRWSSGTRPTRTNHRAGAGVR